MSKVYIIENEKGETIASFDTKQETAKYLGISIRNFDCKMYHLKIGRTEYIIIKDTKEKVKVFIVEVEDD